MRLNNLLNINGIRTFFGRINTLIKWENKIRSEKNQCPSLAMKFILKFPSCISLCPLYYQMIYIYLHTIFLIFRFLNSTNQIHLEVNSQLLIVLEETQMETKMFGKQKLYREFPFHLQETITMNNIGLVINKRFGKQKLQFSNQISTIMKRPKNQDNFN